MNDAWKQRLKDVIDKNPDLNMKRVSVSAGLSETAVRDILVRSRSPQITNFLAIAQAIGVDPCWLLTGGAEKRSHEPCGYWRGGRKNKIRKLNHIETADYTRDILAALSDDTVDPLSKIAALRSAADILEHFIDAEAGRGRLQQDSEKRQNSRNCRNHPHSSAD